MLPVQYGVPRPLVSKSPLRLIVAVGEYEALVVVVVVVVVEVSLVTVVVVRSVWKVVEVDDTIGVAAVVVTVVETVPVMIAEHATEIREGDHVETEAGAWTSRCLRAAMDVAVSGFVTMVVEV